MIHVKNIRTFKAKDYPNAHVERIDRTTTLGNPYPIDKNNSREDVIELYRGYLNRARQRYVMTGDPSIWEDVKRLAKIAREKDVVLLCWCAPQPCHGDVIKSAIKWLNKEGDV